MSTIQGFLNQLRQSNIRIHKQGDKLQIKAPPKALTAEIRQQIGERKAEILVFLANFEAPVEGVPAIQPVSRRDSIPLSFPQERLWFLNQFEGNNSATYNIPQALRLSGAINLDALQRSMHWVIERHESLRSCFTLKNDQAQVQILSEIKALTIQDLQDLDGEAQSAELQKRANAHAITVFDLTSGPLFKADLLLLNSQQSVLLVNMHHIISDGWSIGVFMRDWQHAYTAFYRGQAPSLAKLDIQYYDYANWQRTWLQGDVLQRQLDYWQQQLTGATELLELPTDQPRQAQQGYKGAHYGHCLPATLSDKINSLSREHSVSLFMTMLSAFYIFLSRYSRQDDISVGSPIANRTQNQTEDIIGLFVNTLVFRGKLQAQQDFTDLLRATRKTCLGAYAHQDVPLELLVEKLQPARNLSYSPLFQVMLSIQNNELSEPELPGLEVSRLSADYPVAKFDLTLFVEEREGQLHCLWEYATDLFDASTIERMSRHFEVLLTGIVENPEQDINQLPMLTNIEAEQLKSWSQSAVEYPTKTIVDVFEQQVGKTPDKIALVYQDQQLSYQQVNEEANQLAHYLLMRFNQVGITEHNPLIAIATERSADMVVAVLAILKAGGAYVPIDPSYPAERFNYLLNDCNAPMLLVQAETQVGKVSQNCMVLRLDQTDLTDQPRVNPNIKTHTDDLAYINYTSGSTGQPKGVCIPHQAVVRLVNNASNTSYAQLDSEQIFLHYAAVSFDAATFEIWGALLNGAKVVVMPAGQTDLKALAEILQKQDISILWMTNSLFNIMLEEQPEALRGLKQLLTGGEALSVTHINKAINCLSDTQLINGYGPTENTTFTCCYPITEPSYQHSIPIGKAIANTTVAVVDNMHQPVAVGLVGELVTGGAGLARGYLNRPELSAEKFVELNLFGKADRFYKTGDLVRWRPDGNLEYIGRIDHQVKLRGFRIELGEIEAIISQHSAVNEAVVVLYEADNNKRLVAYITLGVGSDSSSDSNSDLSASETMVKTLTEQLKQQLPEYMQPSHFTVLDLLPLTANGKVDRKALPVPEIKAESGVKPITPTELILANLWSLILKVEVVHRDDNFFKLGGHSLLATQLIARIRDTFQVELPVRSVFEFSQLNALATAIELANGVISLPKVQRQAEGETKVLSFAQQRLWFLDQLEENSSASYNIPMAIQLTGRLNVEALRCSLNWLIERHESLRALFPTEDGLAGVKILDSFDVLSIHKLTGTDLTSSELPGVVVPELQDKINRHAVEPFNLTSGPLFKADLLVLKSNGLADDQQFVLLMSMHHIISDGWSIGVFMRDWQHAYTAFSQNQQPSLEPLDIQYSDYAAWQRQWLQGEVLQKQLDYWQQHLAGIPNLLELPTNKPRPAEQSYKGARYACSLPLELSQGLNHLSREHGVSLFMTVLSAYYILLARYSRQDDICVGTPIANRTHSQAEDLIGFFVNTLVLRGQLQAEKSFTDLLRETRKTCLSAYAHQDIPFEMLVEQVQPTRSLSHSPLFQAMLVLQNNAPIELELPDINIEVLSADYPIAKFDLTLNIEEREGQLFCVWEYATDLFNAVAIKRMAGHFETLLAAITDKPEQAVCDLPMLTARELENLKHCYDVVEDNAGVVNTTEDSAIASHDKSIVTLFETQAENTPDNIALVFEKEQLSYRQLNEQANQLAHQLLGALDRPAKPNTDKPLIAIAVERSMDMVVGILAILKAGCAYVPIDPNYPKTRIAYLLKDSAAPILLTQNHLKSQLPLEDTQSLVLCLDALPSVVQPLVSPERKPQAADLAYIIYTSGSTGQPKGCQVTHNNVTRLFSTSEAYYQFNHQDVWTLFHSYAFDFSVWEIWGALLYGAKLVIVPYFTSRSPVDFYQLLIDEKVTVLNQTPSAFQQLIKIDENKVDKNIASPADKLTLRWVIMGGEALDFNSIQPWFDRHGDESPQLVNMYGITETTVHVTHCPITSRLLKEQQYSNASLIGKPLPDLQVWILDAHLKAVPVGVPGEMYVGGAGVTRGYLNQPELSEERFIDVEILGKTEHVYKTGDLARWLPGANDRPENLEYLGRIDSQIKLRGFRIELGEIESLISQHPAVNDALVTLFEGESLVVYFTTDSEPNSITDELKEYIKTRLPDYMVPRLFVALDELRLTAHGKIDRKALPAPTFSLNQKAQYHAPCTQEEHALAGIWSEVLGLEKVGLLDNFFDLGGHSLLAVQLISEINHYLSADDSSLVVSIRDLFEAPTLADLALKINEAMSSSDVESRTAKITIDKPSFDLNAEVQLIPAVENHGLPPYSGDLRKPKNILLTGASGFLGAFLLRELLAKSSANIYCLVRASSNEAAQSRLVDQLKAYHTWDDAKALRIKTLCGDLSQPLFGLAQETFERLGREIDVIYHNGALVNHFYPYSVLKSPNVSGTQEVLRLAATSKLKPVHYVSTIGVLSVSSESVLSEKSLPADGNLLEGGYNQSKWVAEKILQKAQLCGVPVTVYRPAIVGGHSQSGVWNVKDFRSLMIYASLNLGCWPELDMHWNIAPVEHVSQAIVYLSSRSDSQGEVFHPVNAQDINSRQVFELLAKIGYRITPCSPEEWVSRLQATAKASQDDNLLGLSTFFERPSSSEKRTNNKNDVEMSTIDSQYSVARISEGDIRCPALDERILKNYLSFFEACGFLPNQTDINRRIINYVSSKQDAIRGKDEMLTTGDNC